ncbi:MAG TPA: tRNA 4-thiouridine(8) synthase ThiI [Syntrophomonadaceae bacterium]|nr:tRNA 4-thiouridine(8) synthase ThiI [Syntrophomonadaceae bacterium]HPU49022.1 tRNA 4-thiouridine(8) synthase ThiI [Syntrophomonadaceae bacterium]
MKAISLFSGGLDSQLSVRIIQDQGIDVVAVHFESPFFGGTDRIKRAARRLGIELLVRPVGDEYIEKVLKNPVYGYGKNLNPCIDCHAFMFRKAGDLMPELGASFIITGEVLGQRPMSQNRNALNAVDKLSGYKGYIVRPLSGKLLDVTIPEKEGWIDRDKLLDISGRSRTRQMQLAEKYGIKDYPSPAGGCLLTEQNYVRRLKHIMNLIESPRPEQLGILRVGRHFYLEEGLLLAVGRNHAENERLEALANSSDLLLKVTDRPGPVGLLRAILPVDPEPYVDYAGSIVARYSDAKNENTARVKVYTPDGQIIKTIEVVPLSPEQVPTTI